MYVKTLLRTAAALVVVGWATPTVALAGQSPPDTVGLRLDEVLALARAQNPRVLALQSAAQAAAARVPGASTLPDPTFQIGVMNFGLPDLNTNMPTSMAPSVQLMQRIPFPGKLSLAGDIASYGKQMADASADEIWWGVRDETSAAFFDLYALDRRIEVMHETLGLLQNFRQIAKASYTAGTGHQADVLRADVEVARMEGDIRQMEAMRVARAANLNALLDRPAATPVASPVLGRLPLDIPCQDTLVGWARQSRPMLLRSRLAVERANKAVDLAHKQVWPDVTVGLTYGQRDRGLGTERMGSAMIGFSLPIHAGSRQLAARDEAAARQRTAVADLSGMEASVDARIAGLLAELDRARTLAALYRERIVPEAKATVQSALSSYRVGQVDFMTLVDAQMTENQYEGELYQLQGEYGKAVAALESAVGRTLPRTGTTLAEAR